LALPTVIGEQKEEIIGQPASTLAVFQGKGELVGVILGHIRALKRLVKN
jgi:hypothetical protein